MACIFLLAFATMLLPFSHLSLYVAERRVYLLDKKARLYHPSAYYLAHSIAGMPFSFVSGVLLALVAYALVGLVYSARAVLLTGLASGLLNMIAIQVLVVAVTITPTQDIAAVVTIAYDALAVFLAGFLVPIKQLIPLLAVVSFVSPMRYYFALVVTLQTEPYPCLPAEELSASMSRAYMQYPCVPINRLYDIRGTVGLNFGALCIILVVLHVASFAALKLKK